MIPATMSGCECKPDRAQPSRNGGLVKRPAVAALLTVTLAAGLLLAQQGLSPPVYQDKPISQARLAEILDNDDGADPNFVGSYDDAKLIVQDKQKSNQFVFVRLIYNGRIQQSFPHYAKNWYTDS